MSEKLNEKSFIDNTIDKVSDFVNPNKINDKASFKDTFTKALENGVITKEELEAIMQKFEADKIDINSNTGKEISKFKTEVIKGMLKNGFDIRSLKDITNLERFIDGTNFKKSEALKTKLNELKAFYEGVTKSGFDGAVDRTLNFLKIKDITLTLNDKNEIVEMGILDFNNPLNDNEAKVDKEKYSLDGALKNDKETKEKEEKISSLKTKVNGSIDEFEKKKSEELDALRKSLQSDLEELKKLGADTKDIEARLVALEPKKIESSTNTEETKKEDKKVEKKKSKFDEAKEYHSKYTKDQIKNLQERLGVKSDGKFGKETYNAILKFQKDSQKLKVDGKVGSKTQDEMGIQL